LTAAGPGFHRQRAGEPAHALAHRDEAVAAFRPHAVTRLGREAHAIVADVERDDIVHVGEGEADAARPGVLGDVRERFLRGAQ